MGVASELGDGHQIAIRGFYRREHKLILSQPPAWPGGKGTDGPVILVGRGLGDCAVLYRLGKYDLGSIGIDILGFSPEAGRVVQNHI